MNGHELDRRSFLGSLTTALGSLTIIPKSVPFFPPKMETLCGIDFDVLRYAHKSPRRYLFVHGDEPTARDILQSYMYDHNGVAYLVKSTTRDVVIEGLKIDPNRMFSRLGAQRSFQNENPGVDVPKVEAALDFLDREREKLVRALTPLKGSSTGDRAA